MELTNGNGALELAPALTVKEVAALEKVARQQVMRWIHAGELTARRHGHRSYRIEPEHYEQFKLDREVVPAN